MLSGKRRAATTLTPGLILAAAVLTGARIDAGSADLATSIDAPGTASPGELVQITVGYANDGPDTATSAYVQAYIPSGVPAPLNLLSPSERDALQLSAVGTDTLGNAPVLYDDERFCEHLVFQLQRSMVDDGPITGLEAGTTASFSFELAIPVDGPRFGRVSITEPASLARVWRPALTPKDTLEAADVGAFSRGECEIFNGCAAAAAECLGARVSFVEPIEAEFELVDDGSGDPTLGCGDLLGFTPGNIAVIRRGSCEFGEKASNAERAGAAAAFVVNDGHCGTAPDSDRCVINMYDWAPVTIPIVMVALADGEPIIAALEESTTVRGVIGPQNGDLIIDAVAFLTDPDEVDPDPADDRSRATVTVGPGDHRRQTGRRVAPDDP